MPPPPARELLLGAYRAALAALEPRGLAARAVAASATLARAPAGSVLLLGAGKAAATLAAGACDALGSAIAGGFVVVKDVHAGATLAPGVVVAEASHPVPDARSLAAGRELLARAAAPGAGIERIVAVWSGGASALAVAPASGLGLADKATALAALAAAGTPIGDLNAVRKHLSVLKGGRLGVAAAVPVEALVLSDVVGDDLATIGSGPWSPDPSSFAAALAVVGRAGVAVPAAARRVLERGARGELDETPKPGDGRLAHVAVELLAGPDDAGRALARALEASGVATEVELRVGADVAELASRLARAARELAAGRTARALVVSGEPTLRLPARPGRGGRAQHAALLVARELAGLATDGSCGLAVLCVGTDGTDGPTPDAGGLVDGATASRARARGVDVGRALEAFDAGPALAAAGDLVTTGPTGTNLADLYAVVALP
ncbi:MAG: DUF4147 domain-containing protein [Myxococcales bacterium]|nr:DUF4147 domain-containing protein [Myxococcales bacterium]